MSMESEPTEVNCSNCVGACCRRGSAMRLTKDEAYKHRRSMELQTLLKPRNYPQAFVVDVEGVDAMGRRVPVRTNMMVPSHYGFYVLLEDCGYLTEEGQCSNYDKRPGACREYEMGSDACMDARAVFGLDGHEVQVEIRSRLDSAPSE